MWPWKKTEPSDSSPRLRDSLNEIQEDLMNQARRIGQLELQLGDLRDSFVSFQGRVNQRERRARQEGPGDTSETDGQLSLDDLNRAIREGRM